jgi:hypothetical protein
MLSRRFATLTCLAILLSTTACGAGWRSVSQIGPKTFQPYQQAQLWTEDGMVRLHALRLADDSVSGIPFLQPLACDSCRIAFSRERVDSIRVGDPTGGFWGTLSLITVAALIVGVMTGRVGPMGT